MDTPSVNPDSATLPPRQPESNGTTLPFDAKLTPTAPSISIPDYDLLGELGRGGMGVVYRAQHRKLKRIVALKMVLGGGHASDDSLGRFRAEAEAVARLQHPHIVQVYEVGESNGTPYFSLEFVDGGSLDKKLQGTPLPARESAKLVQTLALAVQHAHDHGIVHRDLKPANVLLTDDGTPKVTDFGLAKQIGSDSGQTRSGAVLGTPSYMAPEQAAGDTKAIGPLADVYALGAILYECLTGRPPFRAATALDTVLQVVNEAPVAPSRLQPGTPRDLETVCLKCLYKDPKRRYDSATELGDDLGRFLNEEPIHARPASRWEKTRHWCRKNPRKARFLATASVALIVAGWLFAKSRSDAIANAERSELERRATADALEVAEAQKKQADIATGAARKAEAAVQTEKNAAVARLYASSIDLAYREWEAHNVYRAEQLLNECPQSLRGWEWDYVKSLCRQDVLRLSGHFNSVDQLSYSPDGQLLFSSAADKLRIWNLTEGRQIAELPHSGPFAVHSGGKSLAVGSNGEVSLLSVPDGRLLQPPRYIGQFRINALAFSPDGLAIHVSTQQGGLWRWDYSTAAAPVKSKSAPVFNWRNQSGSSRPVFNHDASMVSAGSGSGNVDAWKFATGDRALSVDKHVMHVTQTAFSPNGKLLASAGADAQIILWNLGDSKEVRRIKGHGGAVHCVAFSPDGKRLASGGEDMTVRLWDVATGDSITTFRGHVGDVLTVAFSPDGKQIASSGNDKIIRIWDTTEPVHRARANLLLTLNSLQDKGYRPLLSPGGQTYYGQIGATSAFAFSRDGRFVATSGNGDPSIIVWDLATNKELYVLTTALGGQSRMAFSPDGKLLVTATPWLNSDKPAEIVLWSMASGKPVRRFTGSVCEQTACAFSPDGRTLSVAFRMPGSPSGAEVISWDLESGKELWRKPETRLALRANSIAYSPDGRELILGIDSGVLVWPIGADTRRLAISVPAGSSQMAVASSGIIATGGQDASIRLWSLADGKLVATLDGHVGNVRSLAFNPDGKRLISAGNEMAVKVWDVPNGRELLTFRDHRRPITQVGWSPDGTRIASSSLDRTLKVWKAHRYAGASASDWPVLFSDNFERDQIGAAWSTGERAWTIEGGEAVGTLARLAPTDRKAFPSAVLTLKAVELPTTFALRFDVRADQPLMASAALFNPRTKQRLQPFLSGRRTTDLLFTGASLMMMSSETLAATVGVPQTKFVFEPGRTYRVRVVREPKNLLLDVDGVEILSERIPDFEGPVLSLGGAWGDIGNTVRFDNVELRAPIAAVRARQIRSQVEKRFDALLLKSLVADEFARDESLSTDDRQTVAKTLSDCQENVDNLAAAALAVVREPKREPNAYRLALDQAREIVKRMPENWRFAFVLGIAQYRVGEFAAATERIESSIEMARKQDGAAEPDQWAMLALTANRLKQNDRARDAYVRMRDSRAHSSMAETPDGQHFVGEVARELHLVATAAQPADSEKEAIKKFVWDGESAGWDHGDLAAYMAARAADYHEILARSEHPGPHDNSRDRAAIHSMRQIQFRPGRSYDLKMIREDVSTIVSGDRATLCDRLVILNPNFYRVTRNVYELRRIDGRWQIVSLRFWPVSERNGQERKTFDATYWAARDAEVEEARKSNLPHKLARALHAAQRDREALPVARRVCENESASAADWAFRGELALEAGETDDARSSFRKALDLDAEVELPWYRQRNLWVHRTNWGQAGVAFLPDGRLASGDTDKVVGIFDAAGRTQAAIAGASDWLASLAATPDGKTLVAGVYGGENELLIIDVASRKIVRKITGHSEPIFRVAVSPDGRKAISASADHSARVWDIESGSELLKLQHTNGVLGAVFSPDGSQVATASHDKTARLWDAASGREVTSFPFRFQLIRVAYHPDGKHLAVAGADGTVATIDIATRQVQTWKAHKGVAEIALFSPDGRWLATAGEDGTIRIWDPLTKKKVLALPGHNDVVYGLSFSLDGKRLASASRDGTIRVWDLRIEP